MQTDVFVRRIRRIFGLLFHSHEGLALNYPGEGRRLPEPQIRQTQSGIKTQVQPPLFRYPETWLCCARSTYEGGVDRPFARFGADAALSAQPTKGEAVKIYAGGRPRRHPSPPSPPTSKRSTAQGRLVFDTAGATEQRFRPIPKLHADHDSA